MDFLPWNLDMGSRRSQDLWHTPFSSSHPWRTFEISKHHRHESLGTPASRGPRDLYRRATFEAAGGTTNIWTFAAGRAPLWEPVTLGSSAHGRKGNMEEKEWVLLLPQQTGVFKAACV